MPARPSEEEAREVVAARIAECAIGPGTVYLVTSGEYSDDSIRAAFSTRSAAEAFREAHIASCWAPFWVEEWKLDTEEREEHMPQAARCKFRCNTCDPTHAGATTRKVQMGTYYDSELAKEDAAFSKATPWGSLEFGLDNAALNEFFVPGKQYYVTITPVDEP